MHLPKLTMLTASLSHKVANARQVYKSLGCRGIFRMCLRKAFFYNWWRKRDLWIVGKWIELRGDLVEIDGCRFSVRNPAITTKLKGRFCQDRYEHPERLAIRQHLDPKLPVIEFGGSVGVVACLTNRLLENPSHHVVVEANPLLVPLLEENRARNECHFSVLHRVIGYGGSQIVFYQNQNFLASGIQIPVGKPIQVATTCLSELVAQYAFPCCTLICDIEGGEIELVSHEIECLKCKVHTFILETHEKLLGSDSTRIMISQILAAGFQIAFEQKGTYVFKRQSFSARCV